MAIINGKKRYLPEHTPAALPEKKRYKASEPGSAGTTGFATKEKKRYEAPVPAKKGPVKRYGKGQGPKVAKMIDQESTRKFIGAFEFRVWIEMVEVNFSKITNIENRIETEMFVEGGRNDCPVVRQKAKQRADTIIFEKGMTDTAGGLFFSLLRQGMKVANLIIFVRQAGSIVRIFSIDEGLIVSKKFTDLDANSSTVLVERLEIAHSGLSEIPIP